jgi:hypothetical protein
MTQRLTPREWLNKKTQEWKNKTGLMWSFVDPYSSHPLSSECYEVMMRMGIEKNYFGLTDTQEDIEIANAIMIRDRL